MLRCTNVWAWLLLLFLLPHAPITVDLLRSCGTNPYIKCKICFTVPLRIVWPRRSISHLVFFCLDVCLRCSNDLLKRYFMLWFVHFRSPPVPHLIFFIPPLRDIPHPDIIPFLIISTLCSFYSFLHFLFYIKIMIQENLVP